MLSVALELHFSVWTNFALVWSRITLSKITIGYFVFALIHCIIQVILQADAFVINTDSDHFLKHITQAAQWTLAPGTIPVLEENGPLYECSDVPKAGKKSCIILWSPPTVDGSSSLDEGSVGAPTGPIVEVEGLATVSSSIALLITSTLALASQPTSKDFSSSVAASITSSRLVTVISPTTIALPPAATSETPGASSTKSIARAVVPTSTSISSPSKPSGDDDDDDTFIIVDASDIALLEEIGFQQLKRHLWGEYPHGQKILSRRGQSIGTPLFDSNGSFVSIPVSGVLYTAPGRTSPQKVGPNEAQTSVTLNATCIHVLSWPLKKLADSGREDIVFLAFNIWVFGMSIVAILNESMPHIVAAVITHVLTTAWSIFQMNHTAQFRGEFLRLTRDGACQGVNLLPRYWETRRDVEIASLVLNIVALLLSAFLSWRLIKQFGWQTFKRVGASITVNYVYKLVLGLSIVLQLSLFFIITSMALWIDQVCSSSIGMTATHPMLYKGMYIVILILLVPWFACGWFGVRREHRNVTLVFLAGAVLLMVSWGVMFTSITFRLIFMNWGFFAMMVIISIVLSAVTLTLGVFCRLNFGKNPTILADYLKPAHERDELPDYSWSGGDPGKREKINFPSDDVPTFERVNARVSVRAPVRAFSPPHQGRLPQRYTSLTPSTKYGPSSVLERVGDGSSTHTRAASSSSNQSNGSNRSGKSGIMQPSPTYRRWVIE